MLPVFLEHGERNRPEGAHIWSPGIEVKSFYNQEQLDEFSVRLLNEPVQMGWVKKPEDYLLSSAHPCNPLADWVVSPMDSWR